MTHGNCKQFDNSFDSDLCNCGCAAVEVFVTKDEIAAFLRDEDEGETNLRTLAHARAVNARAVKAVSCQVRRFIERFVDHLIDWQSDDAMAVPR